MENCKEAEGLRKIMRQMKEHPKADHSSYPTFGGSEPRDTSGIWSWDEKNYLVGEGTDDLRIVSRQDWED